MASDANNILTVGIERRYRMNKRSIHFLEVPPNLQKERRQSEENIASRLQSHLTTSWRIFQGERTRFALWGESRRQHVHFRFQEPFCFSLMRHTRCLKRILQIGFSFEITIGRKVADCDFQNKSRCLLMSYFDQTSRSASMTDNRNRTFLLFAQPSLWHSHVD